MPTTAEIAEQRKSQETRLRWLLSAPALMAIFFAALGPLVIVLLFSFMVKGDYGDVKYWQFSSAGWFDVFFERDLFDDTLGFADGHLLVLWRSIKLAFLTTVLALILGFPTAYFISTREEHRRDGAPAP